MGIFDRLRKNKNQNVLQNPGKTRLSLEEIALTGGQLRIRDVSNALWFPAGQPINPVAPKGTPPRRYPFQPMSNINWATRDNQIDHQVLRNFSYYPIVRDIIETLKDLLCSTEWDYVLKPKEDETGADLKKRAAADKRIQQVKDFFRKPDGWQPFRVWQRGLYDDMLVIDAASIWKQRDRSGKVCSLVQIDGAQVFPLIDETGQQPDAAPYDRLIVQTSQKKADEGYTRKVQDAKTKDGKGSPAFQLTPYGFPAQEMTSKELTYAVYNRFTYKRYGFSRVETCLAYIAIALGRLDFQAAYYRSGNVPEGIAFLPPDIPIQKVDELNKYLDSILAGNLKNRRKIFFLPSYGTDKQPNLIFPKINEQVLKDEFDEWLARVLCHNFGLSPMAFTKQINRGEAGHMEKAQDAESVAPCLMWMKDSVLDPIIQEDFGFDDIEAVPQAKPEKDEAKLTETLTEQLNNGEATLDEVRDRLGYDTFGEKWSTVPLVKTTNGYVRLDGKNMDGSDPEPEVPPTPVPAGAVPKDVKNQNDKNNGGKSNISGSSGGGNKPAPKKPDDEGGKKSPKAKPSGKAEGDGEFEKVEVRDYQTTTGNAEVSTKSDDVQWYENAGEELPERTVPPSTEWRETADDSWLTAPRPSIDAVANTASERSNAQHKPEQGDPNPTWTPGSEGGKSATSFDDDWLIKAQPDPTLNSGRSYDYVRFELAPEDSVRVLAIKIADGDWALKGREQDPHVTVLYGYENVSPELINAITAGCGDIEVTLGDLIAFPVKDEGQPLVIQLISPALVELHKQLAVIPHFADHPQYIPHICVGYLKPGTAEKYAAEGYHLKGQVFKLGDLTLNRVDKSVVVLAKSVQGLRSQWLEKRKKRGKGADWPNWESTNAYIGPTRLSPVSARAKQDLHDSFSGAFTKIREHYKTVAKAEVSGESREEIEKAIVDRYEAEFWRLEPEVEKALRAAGGSGSVMAVRDLDLTDNGMIEKINTKALEYAKSRSGSLIKDISETTRAAIRNLIAQVFSGESSLQSAKLGIQKALYEEGPDGVFSEYRAKMIARQEVANAQMGAQLDTWKESGLPLNLQWFALSEQPCEDCDANDGEIVAMGEPFPSGDTSTIDSHPWCNCICTAVMGSAEKAQKLEKAFRLGIKPSSLLCKMEKAAMRGALYVMRHGKTALDPVHRSDGWLNFPLSDEGRVKLITAQQYTKEVPIGKIFAPTLKRTWETGEIIQSGCIANPILIPSDEAKTWNLGVYAGMPKKKNKPIIQRFIDNATEVPEGGESRDFFRGRFLPWLGLRKVEVQAGEINLAVWSGSNCRELSLELYGDIDALDLDEGGLMILTLDGDKWQARVIFGQKDQEDENLS